MGPEHRCRNQSKPLCAEILAAANAPSLWQRDGGVVERRIQRCDPPQPLPQGEGSNLHAGRTRFDPAPLAPDRARATQARGGGRHRLPPAGRGADPGGRGAGASLPDREGAGQRAVRRRRDHRPRRRRPGRRRRSPPPRRRPRRFARRPLRNCCRAACCWISAAPTRPSTPGSPSGSASVSPRRGTARQRAGWRR